MTVLTMPARPGHDTAPPPVPWRRMVWVTWRQHRATMISLPAVLGALALFLLFAGLKVHHDYAALTACHPQGSAACVTLNRTFNGTDWSMGNVLNILMQLLPVLLGMFAGAPLLARELEAGTFRYAWTQGVGRVRLTIAEFAMLAVVITVLAWAFSQLFTWFFEPFLPQENMNVLEATVFDTRGIVFAAWTLAAFCIGAFLGMLLRRVIPAMAVTLGVYLVLALGIWPLRKHYPVAVVTDNPGSVPFTSGPSTPNSPWFLSSWTSGGKYWTSYIPVSRFWPMQFIEAGWLLALSLLLLAGTVWLVRRRAA